MDRKKIGIMGGTFDPIHKGHMVLGVCAYKEFELDSVMFMPSNHPPHKSEKPITNAVHRCEMVQLSIEEYPYFQFSNFEIRREGPTYTAQTLQLLCKENPDVDYYFIIGADSLFDFKKWYYPQQILNLAILLVASRDSAQDICLLEKMRELEYYYGGRLYLLHSPNMNISSRYLRKQVADGYSIIPYVNKKVANYIQENNLYSKV